MEETGVVVKTDKNFATVKVERKSECKECGMCLFPKNADYIEFNADNSVGAKVGDEVMIRTSESGKILGALLVFLVPLLLIGVAAVIALTLIKKEIYVLILSLSFITVWFAILGLIDKKLKNVKGFSSEILHIIDSEKEIKDGNKEHNE